MAVAHSLWEQCKLSYDCLIGRYYTCGLRGPGTCCTCKPLSHQQGHCPTLPPLFVCSTIQFTELKVLPTSLCVVPAAGAYLQFLSQRKAWVMLSTWHSTKAVRSQETLASPLAPMVAHWLASGPSAVGQCSPKAPTGNPCAAADQALGFARGMHVYNRCCKSQVGGISLQLSIECPLVSGVLQ